MEVFDGLRAAMAANRSDSHCHLAMPLYGLNRPRAKVSEGLRHKWWLQVMQGSLWTAYECIKVFSETDFTEDLKKIDSPMLDIAGDDDQIVPYQDAAVLSAKLLKNATLKIYADYPHGMCSTNPQVINPDLLAFVKA